jgi:tetratricopeptide (TPR) repeat protein
MVPGSPRSDEGSGPLPGTTGSQGVRLFNDLLDGGSLASEYAKRGAVLTILGRLDEARDEYVRALALDPESADAVNGLAHVLTILGDESSALELLARAPAPRVRPNPVTLNNRGNALLSQGDLPAAIASYREAIAAERRYAMPHRNLALALYALGSRDEAVSELRTYFALSPEGAADPDGHYNLGVMLSEQGRHAEARAEFECALAARPGDAKALNNLGLTHFAEGRPDVAVGWFDRALAADAGWTLARFNLASALTALGRYADAIREYEAVLAAEPQHAQAASNLGALYTHTGCTDAALALLVPLAERFPSVATFHLNLALACERAGRLDDARRAWAAVIEIDGPEGPRASRARTALERLAAP